jgi:hypothetical protein
VASDLAASNSVVRDTSHSVGEKPDERIGEEDEESQLMVDEVVVEL